MTFWERISQLLHRGQPPPPSTHTNIAIEHANEVDITTQDGVDRYARSAIEKAENKLNELDWRLSQVEAEAGVYAKRQREHKDA
jgi:prefoldin subunit 5